MEKELWQSGQPVLTNDLLNAQADLEDAITKRFTDSFTPGILEGDLNQFAISVNAGNTSLIDVATGVAYDTLGNRIAINSPSDVYISFYQAGNLETSGIPFANGVPNGPLTTTNNGIGGFTLTPQNSGSKGITLFSGDVNATSYNYIWIGYLQTVDPSIFVLQNLTNLRLFTSANDGYQIVVVGSTSAPTSINPSTLNPDQTNFSYVYLGCVYNPIHTTPLAIGNVNTNNLAFYSLDNQRLLAVVPFADSDRTPSYTYGQTVDLQDHVGALGHGTVTPENPHGMNLSDLSGVGVTASQLLQLTFTSGIAGTAGLSESVTTGTANIFPTWSKDVFAINPLIIGSPLMVNGVIMDNTTSLGFVTELFMINSSLPADTIGAVLPNDTYTVYVSSSTQTIELAAVASAGSPYLRLSNAIYSNDVTTATSSLTGNANDFPIYRFTLTAGIISAVADLRIFGNISSANLASDITNTTAIAHNIDVTGNLAVTGTITGAIAGLVLPGIVSAFAGSVAPTGYLVCDGFSYTTASHTALFAAIGYAWGGAGANFNVPDLRGVFLRGANTMGVGAAVDAFADPDATGRVLRLSGGETGDNVGSFQQDQSGDGITTGTTSPAVGFSSGSNSLSSFTINSATVNHPSESRPKNAYVMYIIKF